MGNLVGHCKKCGRDICVSSSNPNVVDNHSAAKILGGNAGIGVGLGSLLLLTNPIGWGIAAAGLATSIKGACESPYKGTCPYCGNSVGLEEE